MPVKTLEDGLPEAQVVDLGAWYQGTVQVKNKDLYRVVSPLP